MKLVANFIVALAATAVGVLAQDEYGQTNGASLYVFGDSFADTEMLSKITGGAVPPKPYWESRYSSGPLYVEYLAKLQNKTLKNLATAGCTMSGTGALVGVSTDGAPEGSNQPDSGSPQLRRRESTIDINTLAPKIPSVKKQIDSLGSGEYGYSADQVTGDDLAILQVATLGMLLTGSGVDSYNDTWGEEVTKEPVENIIAMLDKLKESNFKHIAVVDIPNMQHSPMAAESSQKGDFGSLVGKFNQKLADAVGSWSGRSEVSSVGVLSFGKFIDTAIASDQINQALGITTRDVACLKDWPVVGSDNESLDVCDDPGSHFYYDFLHPAEKIHRLFGYYCKEAIDRLYNNVILELGEGTLMAFIINNKLGEQVAKPVQV